MNQRIDHSNYEAWLLDRLEGNLSAEQEAVLAEYLRAHPELDVLMDELPTLHELDDRLEQADKDALKRSLPPTGLPGEPLDDFLIARLEGDLTSAQAEALRVYLVEHPEHHRAERIYALTRLVPEAVAFAEKKDLERHLPPRGMPSFHTLDDHLVARLEGDLDDAQGSALAAFLAANPDAQWQWRLMQRTRVPAEAVVFATKDELKKGGKVIALGAARSSWALRLRVAATVVVLLGLATWALLRTPPTSTGPALVEQPRKEAVDPTLGDPDVAVQDVDDTSAPAIQDPSAEPDPLEERSARPSRVSPVPPAESSAPMAQQEQAPEQQRNSIDPLELRDPLQSEPALQAALPVDAELPGNDALAFEAAPSPELRSEGIPLGTFLAGVVRKRILDPDAEETRPLDTDDAVAAVDKGLRVVAGTHAGLAMDREADGRVSRFDLRLGRNLAISAGR